MVAIVNKNNQEQINEIIYSSSDGEPVAETYTHLYAILTILEVLRQYLVGKQATVLANQFLYYSQGYPRMRVAPDVMVIFNVTPDGRDNYKIWEEGEVPQVIFEVTSPGTKTQDLEFKKMLYEQLGVVEYWLFDPKGEWIKEKLRGYRLIYGSYQLIEDNRSELLKLRLEVDENLISFYREDSGEKLLISDELVESLQQTKSQLQETRSQLQEIQSELAERETLLQQYREKFGDLE
jgi:Uma2 family endonuclease